MFVESADHHNKVWIRRLSWDAGLENFDVVEAVGVSPADGASHVEVAASFYAERC